MRRHYFKPAHRFISEGLAGAYLAYKGNYSMAPLIRHRRNRPYGPRKRTATLRTATRQYKAKFRKTARRGQPKSYPGGRETRGQASNEISEALIAGTGSARCSVVLNPRRSSMVETKSHVRYQDNYATPHIGQAVGGLMYCETILAIGTAPQWTVSSGNGTPLESNVAWRNMQVNAKTTGGGNNTISTVIGQINTDDRVFLASAEAIIDTVNSSNYGMTITYHVVTPKKHTPNTALFTWQKCLADDNAGVAFTYPATGVTATGTSGNLIFNAYTGFVAGTPDFGTVMPFARPSDCRGYKDQYKTLKTKTIHLGPGANHRFTVKALMNQMFVGEVWEMTSAEIFRKGSLQVFCTATGEAIFDTTGGSSTYTYAAVAPNHVVTRRLTFHPVKFNTKYAIEAGQINIATSGITANLKGENVTNIAPATVQTTF